MKPRNQSRLLAILAAALVVIAVAAPAAGAATPAPGYSQFAGCPSPEENPNITSCQRSVITGGYLKLGNKKVPISKPLVLSGGSGVEGVNYAYNSQGGLSKTQLQVPGGVIGLTGLDWLVNFLDVDSLQLFSEPQLAGTPTITGPETVTLPLKFRLINPVLGNNCYIGSNTNPVVIHLSTGTSGSLTGKSPEYQFDPATVILTAKNGTFVNQTFTAPGATGCKLTLLGFIPISLNSVVNSTSGLPAGPGVNETVQNYDLEVVESALVYP
jgi:hypothetical protein